MKKLLIILAFLGIFTSSKASDVYIAYQVAIKVYDSSTGYWTPWTDWESCNTRIEASNNGIVIYSPEIQAYSAVSKGSTYYDDSGGYNSAYNCVDINNKRCVLRLRKQTDGAFQIYIEYNDAMWVYNVRAN